MLERAFHAACLRALSSLEMVVNKGGTTGTGKIARLLNLSAAHLQGILAVGDEIVEVNGRKCDAASLKKALECNDNLFGSSVLLTFGRSCVIALPKNCFCRVSLLCPKPVSDAYVLDICFRLHAHERTVRQRTKDQKADLFSSRLLLAPAHEVLARDRLWQSLQELDARMDKKKQNDAAGVGLVLGVDSRGEPYVENFVDNSPAMRCVRLNVGPCS